MCSPENCLDCSFVFRAAKGYSKRKGEIERANEEDVYSRNLSDLVEVLDGLLALNLDDDELGGKAWRQSNNCAKLSMTFQYSHQRLLEGAPE